jgi:hypothetical protein
VCLEALETPLSQQRIIEITSGPAVGASPGSDDLQAASRDPGNAESIGNRRPTGVTPALASWLKANP